jgi:hypothetical protein
MSMFLFCFWGKISHTHSLWNIKGVYRKKLKNIFSVMAEKESIHIDDTYIDDKYIVNCQHSGILIVFPNTCMYFIGKGIWSP